MERLTEYEVVGGHVHAIPTTNIDTALMRLAAYEDTGMTPEEVNDAVVAAKLKEKSKLVSAFGVAAERLRELAEADKAGRVVVLPEGGESDG